jgi:capsule polysaccharide export protein KpsE/RkpR
MNKTDLLDLKKKIENKKVEISKKEGELDYLKKDLQTKFKLTPGPAVAKKLKELKAKIEKLEKSIEIAMDKLETTLTGLE